MAGVLSQTQVEARSVLSEAGQSSLADLRTLARSAEALAERLGGAFDRVDALLSIQQGLPQPPSSQAPPKVDLAVPLLLDFAQRSRTLASKQDLPGLLASSASKLAPRILLFARRGAELVGWDCFVDGQSRGNDLRGSRLDLAGLRDLSETLDEGQPFNYAGLLEPFYNQLPGRLNSEVAASCFIPLQVADQCIGVLCADSPLGDADIEEVPLRLLAEQAGITMELLLRASGPVAKSEPAPAEAPVKRSSRKTQTVVFSEPILDKAEVLAAVELLGPRPAVVETPAAVQEPPRKQTPEPVAQPRVQEPPKKPAPEPVAQAKVSPVQEPPKKSTPEAAAKTPAQPPKRTAEYDVDFIEAPAQAPVPHPAAKTTTPAKSTPAAKPPVAEPASTPDWVVDFDAELGLDKPAKTSSKSTSKTSSKAAPSSDGDMIWDLDDAFTSAGIAEDSDDGFTGFHVDNPEEDATVARLLAQAAPRDETEEERTARKLARVIVQDVMLYNTKKIQQGFITGNLGDPLAEDIMRGSQHYKAKVAPALFPKRYFWDALLDLLAKGRPELLSTLKIDF